MKVFAILALGLVFGIVHVLTGPDHLSALATLSANDANAFWTGVRWGVGHSFGLVVVAVALLAASSVVTDEDDDEIDVSETISNVLESCVGIFMISLGIYGIYRAYVKRRDNAKIGTEGRLDDDQHDSVDDTTMDFVSMRVDDEDDDSKNNRSGSSNNNEFVRSLVTVGIGTVHGVAGPGGVLGVVPAVQLQKWWLASTYLLSFCFSSTITMGFFAAGYGSCSGRITGSGLVTAFRVEVFSACLSVLVGVTWLVLLYFGVLDDVFP